MLCLLLFLLLESLCKHPAPSGSQKVKKALLFLHPRRKTAAASERAGSEPLRTYPTPIGPDQLFGGERPKTTSRTIDFHYFHPRVGDPSPRETIAGVIFPGVTFRQASKAPRWSPAEFRDCCPINLSCARSRPRTGYGIFFENLRWTKPLQALAAKSTDPPDP